MPSLSAIWFSDSPSACKRSMVRAVPLKSAAEAVLTQIDAMKKAILARAFRGELGTNNPEEASAAEMLNTVLGE